MAKSQNGLEIKSELNDSILKDDLSKIPETKILSDNSFVTSSDNSVSSLGLGIILGIIIGIVIGIVCIFIIRQKPST